jgi:hypothetical protein
MASIRAKKFLLGTNTDVGFEIIAEKTAEIFVLQNKNDGQNRNGMKDNKSFKNAAKFKVARDENIIRII